MGNSSGKDSTEQQVQEDENGFSITIDPALYHKLTTEQEAQKNEEEIAKDKVKEAQEEEEFVKDKIEKTLENLKERSKIPGELKCIDERLLLLDCYKTKNPDYLACSDLVEQFSKCAFASTDKTP